MNYWEQISLSDHEISEALKEAKIRKYFHERNKEYWENQEPKRKIRPVCNPTSQLRNVGGGGNVDVFMVAASMLSIIIIFYLCSQ